MRLRLLIAVAALALPAPAAADTTVTPAPNSYGLSADGGYMVWSERSDGGWRLVVRRPNGPVTRPALRAFENAPTLSTGTIRPQPPAFRVVATYGRDDGDAYQLDLATGRETRLRAISSRAYRETAV